MVILTDRILTQMNYDEYWPSVLCAIGDVDIPTPHLILSNLSIVQTTF